MEYAFSPSKNLFYVIDWQEGYGDSWPSDVVEVSKAVFDEFSATAPDGQVRGVSDDGLPAWVNIPPPTHEQLVVEASARKNQLRAAADTEIEWRQDAVDADIATEEEAATLAASKKYRVLLMRIDTSKAPDISWPEKPF